MARFNIKDNTVSAVNQLVESETIYYLGNKNAGKKILLIGNSITRHGVKKDIGWFNDWGMAASSQNNDYVHQLYFKLKDEYYFMVRQAAYWEMNFNKENVVSIEYKQDKEFDADIVVFMIGENVTCLKNKEDQNRFYEKYGDFVRHFMSNHTRIILTSCIWRNPLVDEVIKKVANDYNLVFLDKNYIGDDPKYLAIDKYEHKGVGGHPGDFGMSSIASLLYSEIIK